MLLRAPFALLLLCLLKADGVANGCKSLGKMQIAKLAPNLTPRTIAATTVDRVAKGGRLALGDL